MERDLIDDTGEVGRGGVHQRSVAGDFNGLRRAADAEACLDIGKHSDLNRNGFCAVSIKARSGNGYVIGAGLQVDDAKISGSVCHDLLFGVGSGVGDRDFGVADDCTSAVENVTADCAVDCRLGAELRGNAEQKKKNRTQ